MTDEIDFERYIIKKFGDREGTRTAYADDEKFNQRLVVLRFFPYCDECNDADSDLYERCDCNNGQIDSCQSWSVILEIKAKKSILEDTHREIEFESK